jgi:DNA polymerase III epsilon subunit family exonuclease
VKYSDPEGMITKCNNSRCQATLRVPDAALEARIRCPRCGSIFSPLQVPSFVIFDLETTGLYPDGCEIIQIAATRFRNGEIVAGDAFFSYCRPGQRIPRFISDYTGITEHDVRNAPRPIDALAQFSRFVGGSVIMAHNGHRFDIKFLEATCRRHRSPTRTIQSIDSISLSKRLFGATRGTGHSLDRVMQRLGLNVSQYQRHDARGDIMALADSVKIMWQRLGLDPQCSVIARRETVLPII